MKVENTVEISKPPSDVYEFLVDEENLSLWIKNFIKLERLEGEEGEVGSTSKHIYNENGKTIEFIEEITAKETGKLFKGVLRNRQVEIKISNELFLLADNSTRLVVVSEFYPQNLIIKIVTFFSKKSIIKRQRDDLQRLKEAIEELTEDFDL
ncbi:MAG: putative membrane protein [Saprospiraceae bacterium]|jgi:uncharacterized membrane protein